MNRHTLLDELASTLSAIRRSHPLRVAIDGVDAVGKTTLADELAVVLRKLAKKVIRASVDGFHNPSVVRYRQGRTSPRGYFKDSFNYAALKANLLDPLGPKGSRQYRSRVFDYRTDSEVASAYEQAEEGDILLFDGVFLQCEQLQGCWDFVIWIDASFDTTVARAIVRDKTATADQYGKRYVPGQKMYIEECRPLENAHLIVNNEDLANPSLTRRFPSSSGAATPKS